VQQCGRNVSRRTVVKLSNCSRMGVMAVESQLNRRQVQVESWL